MPKFKPEPAYKIRKPVALHSFNGTSEFIVKELPNLKKPLEKFILDEWILEQSHNGRIINIVASQENPDFLVRENNTIKGVELMRLSGLEEENQAVSSAYGKKLRLKFGKELIFEMFPKVYKRLPNLKSNVGKKLFNDISKIIEANKTNEGGIIYTFKELNIQINFSFNYSETLLNPWIFSETYNAWLVKLAEKWNTDYTHNGEKCILLLYRTGTRIDLPSLNRMVNYLNKNIGDKFEQVLFYQISAIGSQFHLINGKTDK